MSEQRDWDSGQTITDEVAVVRVAVVRRLRRAITEYVVATREAEAVLAPEECAKFVGLFFRDVNPPIPQQAIKGPRRSTDCTKSGDKRQND